MWLRIFMFMAVRACACVRVCARAGVCVCMCVCVCACTGAVWQVEGCECSLSQASPDYSAPFIKVSPP